MENNILNTFANIECNGRQLVCVVRIRPVPSWITNKDVDFTDYTNDRIWAVIPGWRDKDGNITSLRTGKPVRVGYFDDVRENDWGTGFDYDDGAKVIYTRGWKDGRYGKFFVVRKCRDCSCWHFRAFGEELLKAPKRYGKYSF